MGTNSAMPLVSIGDKNVFGEYSSVTVLAGSYSYHDANLDVSDYVAVSGFVKEINGDTHDFKVKIGGKDFSSSETLWDIVEVEGVVPNINIPRSNLISDGIRIVVYNRDDIDHDYDSYLYKFKK